MGFVLGIVFWHSIGFWRLIEGALERTPSAGQPRTVGKHGGRVAGDLTTLASIDPGRCVTLVLDRASGQTRAAACDPADMPLRAGRPSSRADVSLMPIRRTSAREAWATTVEAETERQTDQD